MRFPSIAGWLTVAGSMVFALSACDRGQKARIGEEEMAKMMCQRGFDSKQFVSERNQSLRMYPQQQRVVRTTIAKYVVNDGLSDEEIANFQVIKAQTLNDNATSGIDFSLEKNCDTMTARFSTAIANELNPFSEILSEQEFEIKKLTTNSIALEGNGLQIEISDLTDENAKLVGPGAATLSLAVKRTGDEVANSPREVVFVQNSGFSHPEAEVAIDSSVELILDRKYGAQNVDIAKIPSSSTSSDTLQKTGVPAQVESPTRFSEARLLEMVLMAEE